MATSSTDLPALAPLLATHPVFGQLPAPAQAALAADLAAARAEAGTLLAAPGRLDVRLGWLLAGAVELRDPDLDLAVRLAPGALFGAGATPARVLRAWQATALTDCTLAFLPAEAVERLCARHRALLAFLPSAQAEPAAAMAVAAELLDVPVGQLLKRPPVLLPPGASIGELAQVMARERISSVLLAEGERLAGIVTDRDLRTRALAPGLARERPARDIATTDPVTIERHRPAFEAQLLMAQHQVHHLPVLEGGRIAGVVASTDLLGQGASAVALTGAIQRADDVEALARTAEGVQALQRNLAAAGASAHGTGRMVTAITDALTRRLLALAEARLGPPPVPYAWVAAGAHARSEQTARTDQDNCLVLDDAYDESAHGRYFEALARFTCDGLDACGYVHCPGGIMAANPRWRQTLRRWVQDFRHWIEEPEPMALMLTSVFFDLRSIAGPGGLLEALRAQVLQRTRRNSLFLAHLSGNALKHRPPLNVFGAISAARGGDHAGTVDLKHAGIVPIVDLARVYALAHGGAAVNTFERLAQAPAGGEVSEQGARDLRDALEFLGHLRICHQARQLAAGQAPDNHLPQEEISGFERTQLREAFAVVRTLQAVLAQRY